MITKIMNTLKNFITNVIIFLVASFYILYLLYIRLIMERLPRILFIELTPTQILITLAIIVCLSLRIYSMLKTQGVIKEKEKKSFLVVGLLNIITWIATKYTNIWINFHRMFVAKYLTVHNMVLKLANFLWNHRNQHNYSFVIFIVFLFRILPRIIVVSAFWVDILVYQEFYFYYKTLGLLLLPLIYNAIFAMLFQFYKDHMDYFKDYLLESCIRDPDDEEHFHPHFKFIEGYRPQRFTNMVDFIINHYYPIQRITTILASYDAIMEYFKLNWLILVILVLHLIGWIIILLKGLG